MTVCFSSNVSQLDENPSFYTNLEIRPCFQNSCLNLGGYYLVTDISHGAIGR